MTTSNHNPLSNLSPNSETFLSKFIKILLNTAGIGLKSQNCFYLTFLKYYLLISFLSTTFFQTVLLKECKTMYEVTLTLAYIFSDIFLNTSTFVLHMQTQNIINILHLVKREIPLIMDLNKDVQTSNEKFRNFFFSYGMTYFVIYGFACMSPFIFFPISGNKLGDTNTLLIPSWFPWQIDSGFKYILTIGLQFSWLFPLSIPVLLNFTFLVYFIIEVRIQYGILCGNILQLKDYSVRHRDGKVYVQFQRCIRHHQLILKFVGNFCTCYNWVFIADLVYSLANLSLLLYGIVLGEQTVSALMQQFSAFVLVFSFLFLYCFIGETLQSANEQLKSCLYDIEWFRQPVKFKKSFFVFMCIIQRDVNLKAGSNSLASYELFFSVVKLAYSYFNVLTSTFSH